MVAEIKTPAAPESLTPGQREIWGRIIGSLPPGHIGPAQWGLLAHFCVLEDVGRSLNTASPKGRRELRQGANEMVRIARALRLVT
jgi:hypothetical protein